MLAVMLVECGSTARVKLASLRVMRNHYSTDVEGGAPVRRRYAIRGRLEVASYLEFVAERARWLDVRGWVSADGAAGVTLVAAGPEALVGALEMACTLGPLEALVETIEAVHEAGPVGNGFEVRGGNPALVGGT